MKRPHPDTGVILREAAGRLEPTTRRLFLRRALGLGSLTLLAGCDVTDGYTAEAMLGRVSDFNDRVQAWLFSPERLAANIRQARSRGLSRSIPSTNPTRRTGRR